MTVSELTITQADDWHVHLRDGSVLGDVLPFTARQFARAIVMPNLKPPICTIDQAAQYLSRITALLPVSSTFTPLMTLYLTDNTPAEEIRKVKESSQVYALKYYPAGATTNSDYGVTDLQNAFSNIALMEELDIPLLIHGEVSDPNVDIFDREKVFIDRHLSDLVSRFPRLRIVLEHITTREAVQFIQDSNDTLAATITPQHLWFNRNAMLSGGIHPHYYCLPVLKRETHRLALLEAAISGNAKFFLGTDSAPHAQLAKQSECGCAGMFSAHAALEFYAEIFEHAGALDKLEGFASFFGADFYKLPRNKSKVKLVQSAWTIPHQLQFGDEKLVPMMEGQTLRWKFAGVCD